MEVIHILCVAFKKLVSTPTPSMCNLPINRRNSISVTLNIVVKTFDICFNGREVRDRVSKYNLFNVACLDIRESKLIVSKKEEIKL